jgi:hypothetical protein
VQAKDVAECSVGIRDGMEEAGILAIRTTDADGSKAARRARPVPTFPRALFSLAGLGGAFIGNQSQHR